jgi:hypothetical protein
MSLKQNVIRIWKSKGQILEGIKNSVFQKEDVEQIAEQRMSICRRCPLYTTTSAGCMVPGTEPCCNEALGGCGCSLHLKTRSLSSDCPKGHWPSEISQQEEDQLNQKLGL